jgi:thiamine biosynthesis lipoprotein
VKRGLFVLLVVVVLISFWMLYPRSQEPFVSPPSLFTGNEMTIDYRILVGEPLAQEQKLAVQKILQRSFAHINAVYNKWNPDSEISRLNRLQAGVIAPLSKELAAFLEFTQQIVELSEGRFDPTIEPLQQLWKQKLGLGQIPTEREIALLIPAIGWHRLHFDHRLFYKDHDLTSLDLGGIAKGHCVDLIVEALNQAGYENVYVEWGGEIRTSGKHPEQRPWRVFISNLGDNQPDNALAYVDLANQAIATSGDYLQQWKGPNQTTYFHIFNPSTYRPLISTEASIASASVLASSCALADGLATVAMLFPSVEQAQVWLESVNERFPEVRFWLTSRSDSLALPLSFGQSQAPVEQQF